MITKYIIGNPIETEAVIKSLPETALTLPAAVDICPDIPIALCDKDIRISMNESDIVYGLGENVRGINKRGFKYISYCTDDPNHSETKNSLYGAHNFILINRIAPATVNMGIFIDTPGKVTFDLGFTDINSISISPAKDDYKLYIIVGDTPDTVINEFRGLIGRSYIAPKWGFGYAQSRWGYKSSDDFRKVLKGYRDLNLPLDAIYMDIDYMERYKDFTTNKEAFPDFEDLISEMKEKGVRIVPIIDGGVKIEKGYDVYEEGVANNYFCKDENGEDFVVGVWPGDCHFPDFLNDEARAWFGNKYKFLLDKGIEGFWNDMNEPAIFYSKKHLKEVFEAIDDYKSKNLDLQSFFDFKDLINTLSNNEQDYKSFYHNYKGKKYLHDDVHNLFGYYMTRGAKEAFDRLVPDKRILMVSRASYIGMHRYAGIWQGDNTSIWSHLLMNLQMMPSLNMCGFLYVGADMGGFGDHTTEDLLLRWTALSMFTPLMRNHSALGTREQEFYQFKSSDLFRNLLHARYRMIPYLYSEYMKAALNDTMMFRPLGFEYGSDPIAREIEDQLLIGHEIMIAPVVIQNASGRVVYFPERMKQLRFAGDTIVEGQTFEKGYHYIETPLGVSDIFLRDGHSVPIGDIADSIDNVDTSKVTIYTCGNAVPYDLYDDDGITPLD